MAPIPSIAMLSMAMPTMAALSVATLRTAGGHGGLHAHCGYT